MLHHIATRGIAPSWEFPELKALRSALPWGATLEILLADSPPSEILTELDRLGWLELVLTMLGELSLERIMQALSAWECSEPALSLAALIEVGYAAAATGGMHRQWPLSGQHQAIRLWVRMHRQLPLRAVWHGLRLLQRLLEMPALLLLRDSKLLADPIPFPQWCKDIVIAVADALGSTAGRGPGTSSIPSTLLSLFGAGADPRRYAASRSSGANSVSSTLLSVLDALRPLVPSSANVGATGGIATNTTWITSDCAGILLMLSNVRRLDLTRLMRKPEFVRYGGVRAFSFLLAGVGMSLLKPWNLAEAVEPAVAIFAGMLLDPDYAGMRQFFSESDPGVMADFAAGDSWPEALDCAAAECSRAFAERVRGFRKASREAVLRKFIRIHGRILVEESRLLVVLDSSPWAVALHLSGMDDPIEGVEWLGRRRVDFVLEGL
jgi:hypothetical protein